MQVYELIKILESVDIQSDIKFWVENKHSFVKDIELKFQEKTVNINLCDCFKKEEE